MNYIMVIGLMSSCELINFYEEINSKCVTYAKEQRSKVSIEFVRITQILHTIKQILQQFKVKLSIPSKNS